MTADGCYMSLMAKKTQQPVGTVHTAEGNGQGRENKKCEGESVDPGVTDVT